MPLPHILKSVSMPVVGHKDCWAKTDGKGRPGISVEQHCRTAGIVAGILTSQFPAWLADTLAVRNGVVLAAFHDIGKVSPGFQKKCLAWLKMHNLTAQGFLGTEEDHAKVSQKTLQDFLCTDNLRFWAAIVGAHHGKLKGDRLPSLCDGGADWTMARSQLVEALLHEFGPLPDQAVGFDDSKLWFNAGLIAVADWLASDEYTFPPSEVLNAGAIRNRAEKQLDRIGFRPAVCPLGKTFVDLFPFPSNELQSKFTEAVRRPGVYVVEAAMGCGKTEAALMAAYTLLVSGQATGIYFALPTQVTSNRIHRRVADFVDRIGAGAGTRLIHGNSWLLDAQLINGTENGSGRERVHDGRDWFASSRRALLAPFGVGTVDQALLGVVAAKHFFVRQFGLAGKVVILDEVHSYDLYTGTLVVQLVKRLRDLGATVIILSATLTAARRRDLLGCAENETGGASSAYPLLSMSVDGHVVNCPVQPDEPKTVQVSFMPGSTLPESVLMRAGRGDCVLWIRNTVNEAQETYRELCGRNKVGGPEIALLHSRFPQFRREELENDWLGRLGKDQSKRPTVGCVLVSTQVTEQSVDIDADLLVTDLAPTDMLLQRLGRLWLHKRKRPEGCVLPEVWIAKPGLDMRGFRAASSAEIKAAFGKSSKVYAPYVLLRTFALWCERAIITLPTDIRPLLEASYADPPADEPVTWSQLREELEARKKKLQQTAIANSNPWQLALNDEEGIQTRWNSNPTAVVLLVRRDLEWDEKKGARLELLNGESVELRPDKFVFDYAKAIHRNLVKVPRWCLKGQIGSTPSWLREYFRGGLLVCELSGEILVSLPIHEDSGLTYRDDLGVVVPQWKAQTGRPQRCGEEDDDESYD